MSCRAKGAARAVLQFAAAPPLRQPPLRREPLALAKRCFASGFDGFPFGGGFPGGQGPPRGDSDKLYNLLGVGKNATEKDMKQAYKKLAMKHHPDRGGDEDTFKSISRAYEVLTNPEKRQIYDQYGEDGLNNMEGQGSGGQGPGMDPFDLFSQIFGFNAGGRGQRARPITPDSTYELQISLEELYTGTSRNIVFTRDALCGSCNGEGGHDRKQCGRCGGSGRQIHMQQMGLFVQQVQTACSACDGKGHIIPPGKTCQPCRGKGTVKEKNTFNVDVEAGCQNGQEFRYKGQADQAPDHDTGDVVIVVREKQHNVFQRVRDTLLMSKRVTLAEALCGFEFTTQYLDGKPLTIRSEPGQVIRPTDMMRIEGKGMPRSRGQPAGDLLIIMDVEFPESIPSEGQDDLLKILGGTPLPVETQPRTEVPQKMTQSQKESLKRQLRQRQNADQHRGSQQQQTSCAQQ